MKQIDGAAQDRLAILIEAAPHVGIIDDRAILYLEDDQVKMIVSALRIMRTLTAAAIAVGGRIVIQREDMIKSGSATLEIEKNSDEITIIVR